MTMFFIKEQLLFFRHRWRILPLDDHGSHESESGCQKEKSGCGGSGRKRLLNIGLKIRQTALRQLPDFCGLVPKGR